MKYYTEIESDFFLPVNIERDINHDLDNSKLPKSFYEKYQNLINLIPKIKEIFAKFTLNKYYYKRNFSQHEKEYFEWLLKIYKIKYLKISSNLNEDLTLLEMRTIIQCWGNILDFMFMVDNTLFERNYFICMMQLFNSALIDIGEYDGALRKGYLPNKWLLTSKGYLYNMRTTAHEAGFFGNYYLEKTKEFLAKSKPCICEDIPHKKINPFPEWGDRSIILKNGFVRFNILDDLLHFKDYYHFNYRIYDPKIIMASVGMLELQDDLYNFFKKLELYTVSPKDSLRKVIEITNNKYLDVLVRCCGVSKLASSPPKTIVTSLLTAKDDFKEYLEKGYDVCFIPPIIINKETRMLEELNMDSYIVNEYIRNEVIYESELGGRVYTNHIKF